MSEIVLRPLPIQPRQHSVKVSATPPPTKTLGIRNALMIFLALLKGLAITGRHLFRKPMTFNYPNRKRRQADRFRGIHKLQRHPDGLERCVGCGLCAVVCPSEAIYLEAAENTPDLRVSHGERYASFYQIDMLRCIFCGFCEEACPEDAIILGPNWEAASAERDDFIYTKDRLLVPLERKDDFRPGMTWPKGEIATVPTSTDLPEYYQTMNAIPAAEKAG